MDRPVINWPCLPPPQASNIPPNFRRHKQGRRSVPRPIRQHYPDNAAARLSLLSCPNNAAAHPPAPSPSPQLIPLQHRGMPHQQPFRVPRCHPNNAMACPLLPPQHFCRPSPAPTINNHAAKPHPENPCELSNVSRATPVEPSNASRAMKDKCRMPSKVSASAEAPAPLPMPLHH